MSNTTASGPGAATAGRASPGPAGRGALGVGADLLDLRHEAGHQAAAGEHQVLRRAGVDVMSRCTEAAGDPVDQVALVLWLEPDLLRLVRKRGINLFVGLVRLILHQIVDEDQAAVFRKIVQQGDEPRPLLLAELIEVAVRDDDERALGHHRHRLGHLRQLLHRQALARDAVEIELLKARGDELLLHLLEIILAQVALLAAENVDLAERAGRQVGLEFLIALSGCFLLCHDPPQFTVI